MEAIQNAAKHSGASRVTVLLRQDGGRWRLDVTDDGSGFDQAGALADAAGAGLMNMRDRLDAVGGSVTIASSGGVRYDGQRRRSRSAPGRAEMRSRLAWAVVALTTVAFILDTVFTAAHRPLLSEATWADHGWPLAPLAGTGYAVMGALIISRYPRHRLGWLLCAASLLSVTLATDAYSTWVLDGGGPGSAYWAHVAAWAGPLLGWPAFTAQIIVFLTAPDGHLLSPRWRWAAWVALAGLTLHTLGTLTIRPGEVVVGEDFGNRAVSLPLLTVGWMLVAAALIASVVSLVLRLRRAKDDERLQLLWIASAAAMLALGVVCILAIPRIQGEEGTWLAALPLRLAQLAVPVCVAVAVLRHRLLAIDLILNRALVFALATGVVAVGYVVVVVLAGAAVGGSTEGFWPSLLATAVVALAFQPVRGRVVRIADRLAFGAAAAPYEALAEFSRRLGESPDPAALLPAVADAAGRAVNAHRVTVRLHVEAEPDETAWPPGGRPPRAAIWSRCWWPTVPGALGCVEVTMPPGHALRPHQMRLLRDLAEQTALAFRNARLTAELSGDVDRLARRTGDLAESRRRLISAGDAERSRLERAISRQVTPHLAPLPDQLRTLTVDRARHGDRRRPRRPDHQLGRTRGLAEHGAGGAAGDHPRRVPGPAPAVRPAGGSGLARRTGRRRGSSRGRRVGGRATLPPARRGRGVLLRRRGDARPRRARRPATVRAGRAAGAGGDRS